MFKTVCQPLAFSYARIVGVELKAYQGAVHRGLEKMPLNFIAELCQFCTGKGEANYEPCPCCNGYGIRSGWGGAPRSVVNQVLVAGDLEWEGRQR